MMSVREEMAGRKNWLDSVDTLIEGITGDEAADREYSRNVIVSMAIILDALGTGGFGTAENGEPFADLNAKGTGTSLNGSENVYTQKDNKGLNENLNGLVTSRVVAFDANWELKADCVLCIGDIYRLSDVNELSLVCSGFRGSGNSIWFPLDDVNAKYFFRPFDDNKLSEVVGVPINFSDL